MGVRLSFPKLYEFHTRTEMFIMHYKQKLEEIRTSITTFSGATSYSGTVADNVRTYLNETHLTIIDLMLTYLETYKTKQASYIAYVIGLDKFREADLESFTLDQCVQDLGEFGEDFATYVAELKSVFSNLSEICDLEEEYSNYNGNVLYKKIADRTSEYPGQVDFLRTVIEDHETREYAGIVAPLQQYSDSILTLIASVSGKPVATLGNYAPGDIKNCDGYYDAKEAQSDSKKYMNNLPEGDPSKEVDDAFGDYVNEHDDTALEDLYNGAKAAKEVADGAAGAAAGAAETTVNPVTGAKSIIDGIKGVISGAKGLLDAADDASAYHDGDCHYDDNDIPETDADGLPTVHEDDDYKKKDDIKTKIKTETNENVDKHAQDKIKENGKKTLKKATNNSDFSIIMDKIF